MTSSKLAAERLRVQTAYDTAVKVAAELRELRAASMGRQNPQLDVRLVGAKEDCDYYAKEIARLADASLDRIAQVSDATVKAHNDRCDVLRRQLELGMVKEAREHLLALSLLEAAADAVREELHQEGAAAARLTGNLAAHPEIPGELRGHIRKYESLGH